MREIRLPVHPVHKMQKSVLSGAGSAHSAEGAKYAKPFIHKHLWLIGLKIKELRKQSSFESLSLRTTILLHCALSQS